MLTGVNLKWIGSSLVLLEVEPAADHLDGFRLG